MEIRIRPAQPSDLDALKRLTQDAFENVSIDHNIERHFGLINGKDWRWRKARHIDDDVAAAGAAIAVAEGPAGEIIGYITTRVDKESGVGFIPNLAVVERARGLGVGRKLIEHALELFRRAGLELARIETLDQNPVGQHLYPGCGFVEVARQIHFARSLRRPEEA